jgi:hypothetical protein
MFLVALVFVATYGANVPYGDDWWGWLPPIHKGQPITLSWLWSRHGDTTEHRYPMQKLLLVGLYRITGDVRGGMVFDVLILGALAFALILAARRVRGRSSYADAFFPLVLLNLAWISKDPFRANKIGNMHQYTSIFQALVFHFTPRTSLGARCYPNTSLSRFLPSQGMTVSVLA